MSEEAPQATTVQLWVPPHGMESPFDFVVFPPQPLSPVEVGGSPKPITLPPLLERLNALIQDLHQIDRCADPDTSGGLMLPTPAPGGWVLFCPARSTFIARNNIQGFLEVRARAAIAEFKSNEHLVLSVAACFHLCQQILGVLA